MTAFPKALRLLWVGTSSWQDGEAAVRPRLTLERQVTSTLLPDCAIKAPAAEADKVALDAGTLAPLVCKLVAQSLLLRERSPEDERSVIISLTDAGQALQQQAHAVYAQAAGATQCTLEQRQALTAQLQALRAALNHSP